MTHDELPSNWGRWGTDDELGTLHLIDDAARARAAAEVRDGTSVSLARSCAPVPLTTGLGPVAAPAAMPAPVLQIMSFTGAPPIAVVDSLLINTHNAAFTHLDAPAHMPVDGLVYPGVPLPDAVTPVGVRHGSADPVTPGVLTRGVLLDLAPDGANLAEDHRVTGADLDAALDRAGTRVHPGDAVVVRGGWDLNQPMDQPVPGMDLDAVRWLHEHDVSLYVGDIGDARPPRMPMPMHHVALARLGLPLVDAASVDDLALRCAELERSSFMLVIAPPRITGTSGLAVNPLAVL